MPLEFNDDAIILSGVFGTKLKSKIIHDYYNLWWKITSGGKSANYNYPNSIVEMNAATGEIYIEETGETILGSAGCALDLKFNNYHKNNPNLTIILVENDEKCIEHLKNIINRRFPAAIINDDPSSIEGDINQCVLIRRNVDEAIATINSLDIRGRTIYFFDPLLSIDMDPLRSVYERRIESPFFLGVEFLIFFFASDWIYGRKNFHQLPNNVNFDTWRSEERQTVDLLCNVLGDKLWFKNILTSENQKVRIRKLINTYQERLFKLFRFVIPMPFAPRNKQLYHLVFCTNYFAGSNLITRFYKNATNNEWSPDHNIYYKKFRKLHESEISFPGGNKRPLEWRILWRIIRNYRFGKFDDYCRDLIELESNSAKLYRILKWLLKKGYIKRYRSFEEDARLKPRYELNWSIITRNLRLIEPPSLEPLREQNFRS